MLSLLVLSKSGFIFSVIISIYTISQNYKYTHPIPLRKLTFCHLNNLPFSEQCKVFYEMVKKESMACAMKEVNLV